MVRTVGDTGVSVKGKAAVVVVDSPRPSMRISNISEKGIAHIAGNARVQVEFVMMSTKVVFVSSVIAREQNSLLITLPMSLLSIERRKNARYACTEDLMAFLDLNIWKPRGEDVTAPPFYLHQKEVSGYLHIADVSFGGICAVARFPSVNQTLKRGLIDDKARLILPMQAPIDVGIEIRWAKRIKEHFATNSADNSFLRSYRFGLEFTGYNDHMRKSIRQFIQQLSQADAI
jgi:hypothetical protein